jgi:hypothetical protein
MGWVTLDDGQKVYVTSGGKVLARGPGSASDKPFALKGGSAKAQTGLGGLKPDPGAPGSMARGPIREKRPDETGVRARLAERIKSAKQVQAVQEHPETHAQPGDVVNMRTDRIAFDP